MRNVWPVKLPNSTARRGLGLAILTIAALVIGAVLLPGWPQIVLLLLAAVPLNLLRVFVLQRRRDVFESAKWRGVLREGTTPLPGGQAYLTLSADLQELHCVLSDGRFARQSLQGLESLWIEPPSGRQRAWTLRLDRRCDEPLRIRFTYPRDAEGWFWRLLDLRPELGRDAERLRSVDVVGQVGVMTLDQQREWGLAREPRHEAGEQVWAAGVTPEYAEALVEDLAKRNLTARLEPMSGSRNTALWRAEPQEVFSTPRLGQVEPPAISARSVALVWGSCMMLIFVIGLVLSLSGATGRFTSFVNLFFAFSALGLIPILRASADQRAIEAGLSPGALLAEDTSPRGQRYTRLLIPPQDETGFISEGDSLRSFPIAQVESVTLDGNEDSLALTVVIAGEVNTSWHYPARGEVLYCSWLAGLRAHRSRPAFPIPEWKTVVVSRGGVTVEARFELRKNWLDLTALPLGGDLPEGPLVGPVSEAFGMAMIAHIRKGGGDAHLVAYAPSDPKPLCHPPGRPWIASLSGQASRPATALPSAQPSLASEPSAQS